VQVVSVERDVERPERNLAVCEVGDPPPEPLRKRHAPGMDPDEGDAGEIGIALDDLVSDPAQRPVERFCLEQKLCRLFGGSHECLLSGLTGPS
jgi:hypothetical protein